MKKYLVRILLVVVLCVPFFIYPYLRIQKDRQQEQAAVTETQMMDNDTGQAENSRSRDRMKVTWETVVLFGIAAGAGALRFRHAKQMRESAREQYSNKMV